MFVCELLMPGHDDGIEDMYSGHSGHQVDVSSVYFGTSDDEAPNRFVMFSWE